MHAVKNIWDFKEELKVAIVANAGILNIRMSIKRISLNSSMVKPTQRMEVENILTII